MWGGGGISCYTALPSSLVSYSNWRRHVPYTIIYLFGSSVFILSTCVSPQSKYVKGHDRSYTNREGGARWGFTCIATINLCPRPLQGRISDPPPPPTGGSQTLTTNKEPPRCFKKIIFPPPSQHTISAPPPPLRSRSKWTPLLPHQGCGSAFISSGSSILGWIPIRFRIQGFNDQKFKKITAEKNYIFFKNYNLPILGLHKERPTYRRGIQLSKEAIQHFKTWTLEKNYLLLWVIFALLDPNPDSESGSTDPIESGSNPQPCP